MNIFSFYLFFCIFNLYSCYHTENWAVLLCTSRYYFNYRHLVNTLAVYKTLKISGYSDDKIIFMNSQEDALYDPRNPLPNLLKSNIDTTFFANSSVFVNIDYSGEEVTVDSFLKLLINRKSKLDEFSKHLLSNYNSNIFIYMTGHGGDEFFKFQDTEELSAQEFGYAIEEMKEKQLYKEMFIVVDTCQASTMCNYIHAPNVICVGSSIKGENSFAYIPDNEIGQPLMDRFTYKFTDFIINNINKKSFNDISIQKFIDSFDFQFVQSHPSIYRSPGSRVPSKVKLSQFFPKSNNDNYMITKPIRKYKLVDFIE